MGSIFKIIQENFLIGVDFLSSPIVYSNYFGVTVAPHNNFIRVFVELGVIGYLLYLSFFLSLALKFKSLFNVSERYVYLFLIGFMFFSGIGNDSFYYK